MKDLHSGKKPLGQILIEAGVISISQIEIALQEQKYNNLRIGEILVLHGWIEQQTVDFFAERWSKLPEEEKKPLVSYFQESRLLDQEQIKAIVRLKKLKADKTRFHRLAVEQGYLKQITVDYFVAHILSTKSSNTKALAKIYEILEDYANEKKDFSHSKLPKAPLMGVDLQSINLDGSNLKKADLTRANLSQSSLVQVNLEQANLTKAILTRVDFSESLLTEANLRDARLERANFSSAILEGADLRGAYLAEANFAGAQLTDVMLPLHYGYAVYYDESTRFDRDFDPKFMGWKII